MKHTSKSKGRALTPKQYEQIGRSIVTVAETGYTDRRRLYSVAFFKGIFSGLGTVIGATIVLALLLWALSLFSEVPLIGSFIKDVERTIETK